MLGSPKRRRADGRGIRAFERSSTESRGDLRWRRDGGRLGSSKQGQMPASAGRQRQALLERWLASKTDPTARSRSRPSAAETLQQEGAM